MLIAIGIYQKKNTTTPEQNASQTKPDEEPSPDPEISAFVKLQYAPPIKEGVFAFNALAHFEEYTLQNMDDSEQFHFNMVKICDRREFHYIKKTTDETKKDVLIVIVSRKLLERSEVYYLIHNIAHVHFHPNLHITLQDILTNPLGYIGRDALVTSVQQKLDAAKEEALKALDAIIERGLKIEESKYKTEQLVRESRSFHIEAKKVNSGCCW